MEKEIWKPVKGYEGLYEVSNLGRVRSLDRVVKYSTGATRLHKGRIMKTPSSRSGYPHTVLRKNKKGRTTCVHRMVAEAFLPNPEDKRAVNHIDGVKHNNHLSNLEWVTFQENSRHAWKMGLANFDNKNINGNEQRRGEGRYNSKLKEEDVKFIRKNCKMNGGNLQYVEMAKMFGVSKTIVRLAAIKKTWKHID